MLTFMRLGILPFFVMAAWIVYLWARRHFGAATGALAVNARVEVYAPAT